MKRTTGLPAAALVAFLALASCVACAETDDRLHKAAHSGDLARVRSLLQQGVNPDARDSYGGTALHAAMFQRDTRIVELLITHGFDVNAVGPRNGYTPLHDAIWANNLEAARLLLDHGARTDIKGKDGLTPYDKAVREGKPEIARLLARPAPAAAPGTGARQ